MSKRPGQQNRRRAGQRRSQRRSGGHPSARSRAARRPAAARPLPAGDSFATPDASPVRARIERSSAVLLVFLHRVPRWAVFLAMIVPLAVALFVKGVVGAVLLVVVALVLGWLAFVSWPGLRPQDRVIRVVALAVVLAGAGYFAVHR